MAKDLEKIVASQEAAPATSCVCEDGSVSYLKSIICPIYDAMKAEADNNKGGRASHAAWRNYDDFNEYFWSPYRVKHLGWPPKRNSPFLLFSKKGKTTGKINFVEHRTFLHLYRSFHRLWIFLILMFQLLTIIAIYDGKIDARTFKVMLSAGPAFFILNFIECCLDVLLMFGAYKSAGGFAVSRQVIKFIWYGVLSTVVFYLYWKVMEEATSSNSDLRYYRLYLLVLGVYAAIRLALGLLGKIPACQKLSEILDRYTFLQFFKWIYEECYFVGRSMFESPRDYLRYVLIWLSILACKFTFAYFLQIKPLIETTKIIVQLSNLPYSWHDLVSRGNHNALTVASLWAPVFAIYIMDLHIWYTLFSALVGGIMGAVARLGEIRSIEMLHMRFRSFPEAFSKNLVSQTTKSFEIALLLIVYIAYGYTKGSETTFILITTSSWFLVFSWIFAPYIFNPSGFEWQKTVEDFDDWITWLIYEGGVGVKGETSWEVWWDEEQVHIQTLRGRILETILSFRFFFFQYGIVYKLHLGGRNTSLAIYFLSWIALIFVVAIFKAFTFSPKKHANLPVLWRFFQVALAISLVVGLFLLVVLTTLSITDLFACSLAFIATGWAILSLSVVWKWYVKTIGAWDSIREIARMYDAGMGLLIFVPVAILSWFPFVSTFQSRVLFNQAFSSGLGISLILAGNRANVDR